MREVLRVRAGRILAFGAGIRVLLAFQDIPGAVITTSDAAVLKGTGLPIRTVTDVLAQAGMLRDDWAPAIETWFTCGLRSGQLRTLLLTDIRDGRLHSGDRVIPLAAAVRQRLTAYLSYRNDRWPHTANPHLFLSQRTATRTGPVGNRWIKLKTGITGAIQAIREDRILDEAHATNGDARRLCDLFGLSMTAAERYIATADHPDLIGSTPGAAG